MVKKTVSRKEVARREDWLNKALDILREQGIGGIKVVSIARQLNLTSGSFYWHFKNIQDLLDSVLNHWEHHLTDHIVQDAISFSGTPEDRILNLMMQVIKEDAAVPDHAVSVWAKSDAQAHLVYMRTVQKRFDFAKWMFEQVGFSPDEAATRGRLMVTSLMGESSNNLKSVKGWEDIVRAQWRVLVAR